MRPTERFSTRVKDYVRFRPSYPSPVVELLIEVAALDSSSRIADIGSGPGNLTRLFLERGLSVVGVEPNREMREAGDALLASHAQFRSVAGTAEAAGLEDVSIDLIVAAQAFHWFDPPLAKREFARILRPGGWVALIWNSRRTTGSRFLEEYERILLDVSPDYSRVNHREIPTASLAAFFSPAEMRVASFPNEQVFDLEGLLGRSLSSSYVPQEGQPGHDEIVSALTKLFHEENDKGAVHFRYETEVYFGRCG